MRIETFLAQCKAFAAGEANIQSAIVVGSYANGTHTPTSDLDLCIIATDKEQMLAHHDFVKQFGAIEREQRESYGACTSIRVWYKEGPEVEFGIVAPSWLDVPLDDSTRQVLRGGYQVLVDKARHFQNLQL